MQPTRLVALALSLAACGAGPTRPVELVRDGLGVTHVIARSDADAFYGGGYAMARDRLMQMEIFRRQALGTSAELVGAAGLADDRAARVMGFAALGSGDWQRLQRESPDDAALIEAWIAGINRRVAELEAGTAPLPPGAAELGVRLARWRPEEAFAVGKRLSFGMSNTLDQDLLASILLRIAPTLLAKLPPAMPSHDAYILPAAGLGGPVGAPGGDRGPTSLPGPFARPLDVATRDAALRRLAAYRPIIGGAHSNNWAVDGRFTDDGRPLLAGDPHQEMTTPSRLWPVHLSSVDGGGTLDVIGFSFPGTPAVQLGHNAFVGWTGTINFADVMDLWDAAPRADQRSVVIAGETLPLLTRHERIRVRPPGAAFGEADEVTLDVLESPGVGVFLPDVLLPVASSFIADDGVFLRWTGFQPTRELTSYLAMDRASDLDAYERAVDTMEVGAINFVAASASGISLRVHALVPDRGDPASHPMPWHILPAADTASAWRGMLTPSRLPNARDPPRGVLISANNDPYGFTADGDVENDPFYLGGFYANGARARRIDDALAALLARPATPVTRADMEVLQGDVHSLFADALVPHLADAWARVPSDDRLAAFRGRADLDAVVQRLLTWDRAMDADKRAPAELMTFAWFAAARVLGDTIPASLFSAISTRSPPFLIGQLCNVLTRRAPGAAAILGDDEPLMLLTALDEATRWLQQRFAGGDYTWGALQQAEYVAAWPGSPDPGVYPLGGGLDTVRVAEGAFLDEAAQPRATIHPDEVSLYRMVIGFDVDGTPRASVNFTLGASEAPGANFVDRQDDWLTNRHQLLPFKRADIDAQARERVTLQ